jgi:hypothetical protein
MELETCPVTEPIHKLKRAQIAMLFPELVMSKCSNFLSIWAYITKSPEKYYSEKATSTIIDVLKTIKADLKVLKMFHGHNGIVHMQKKLLLRTVERKKITFDCISGKVKIS